MSMTEILDELPRLGEVERQIILRRLMEMDAGLQLEETQEMLEAIDEGLRSADAGGGVSLEEARARLAQWTTK